jgi:hypothetical protein
LGKERREEERERGLGGLGYGVERWAAGEEKKDQGEKLG